MKKNLLKILCLLTIAIAIVCLPTAVMAAGEAVDQILAPIGGGYTNEDGDLVLDADGEFVLLDADFAGTDAVAKWSVLDGKDIVSLAARDGYDNQAIITALDNGEATIIAYLEDDSQRVATAKVIVSNQEVEVATIATLNVSVEGDGSAIRTAASGTELNLGTSYTKQHEMGMVVDLTAVENNNPFMYWVVRRGNDQDIIVSTDEHYVFTLVEDVTIAAVFDASSNTKGTNATFIYNNIVATNMYVKSLAKNVPSAPYQRNMIFTKWISEQVDVDTVLADNKVNRDELAQSALFTATYTAKETAYTVTVVGGSGSGTYKYGEPVTVELTAEAQTGKEFLFWSKDGMPVSYDEEYQFSAMQDCTVTAVFGTAVETDGINMVMQTPVEDGNVIAFTFERYVPESYEFVSSGFVVSKIANCQLGDASNNLMEAVSYRAGVRTQLTKSLTKVSNVSTYYARGYVVYKDGDAIKTIYSAPQKFVLE